MNTIRLLLDHCDVVKCAKGSWLQVFKVTSIFHCCNAHLPTAKFEAFKIPAYAVHIYMYAILLLFLLTSTYICQKKHAYLPLCLVGTTTVVAISVSTTMIITAIVTSLLTLLIVYLCARQKKTIVKISDDSGIKPVPVSANVAYLQHKSSEETCMYDTVNLWITTTNFFSPQLSTCIYMYAWLAWLAIEHL